MMNQFLGMEEWDLQSVVRGCAINEASSSSSSAAAAAAALMDASIPCFSPHLAAIQQDDDLLFGAFPDFFDTTTVLDELEQLYKPFYPVLQLHPPSPAPASPDDPKKMEETGHHHHHHLLPSASAQNGGAGAAAASASASLGAKPKKSRKGQQKRVVQHVTAEGLSSDVWAWRKYGQKPIKGSPYPRSYYRCSSLKGCLARKQVERNRTDPDTFVVTYTAEHSHSHPTRRNSLAGISRSKFSSPKKLIKIKSKPPQPTSPATVVANNSSSSPFSTSDTSATTPTTSAMEDDLLQPYTSLQEEIVGGGEEVVVEEEEEEDQKLKQMMKPTGEIHISDDHEMLNNDFFVGLEEDMGFAVQFPTTFAQPWFAATTAGGC